VLTVSAEIDLAAGRIGAAGEQLASVWTSGLGSGSPVGSGSPNLTGAGA
jgi:hypothetical protein